MRLPETPSQQDLKDLMTYIETLEKHLGGELLRRMPPASIPYPIQSQSGASPVYYITYPAPEVDLPNICSATPGALKAAKWLRALADS